MLPEHRALAEGARLPARGLSARSEHLGHRPRQPVRADRRSPGSAAEAESGRRLRHGVELPVDPRDHHAEHPGPADGLPRRRTGAGQPGRAQLGDGSADPRRAGAGLPGPALRSRPRHFARSHARGCRRGACDQRRHRLRCFSRHPTTSASSASWALSSPPRTREDCLSSSTPRMRRTSTSATPCRLPRRTSARTIVTQSTHKVATALSQGSLLLLRSEAQIERLYEQVNELGLVSTSFSYPILASLEIGIAQLRTDRRPLWRQTLDRADALSAACRELPGVRVLGPEHANATGFVDIESNAGDARTRTDRPDRIRGRAPTERPLHLSGDGDAPPRAVSRHARHDRCRRLRGLRGAACPSSRQAPDRPSPRQLAIRRRCRRWRCSHARPSSREAPRRRSDRRRAAYPARRSPPIRRACRSSWRARCSATTSSTTWGDAPLRGRPQGRVRPAFLTVKVL